MNTLIEVIKTIGDEEAATRWGLTPRSVAAYRRGERWPNRRVVELIREKEGWTYDQVLTGLPRPKRDADSSDQGDSNE
jgi:hypothetical protein